MNRTVVQGVVIALVFLFLGVAGTAAVMAYLPDPGSAPAIFDDFQWSSTANGFWHVNPIGATAQIEHSVLTLSGHSIELDRRVQTDPYETVVAARVRGLSFNRFALGIGLYHAGTVGMEFDDDGVKCGRGTDYGWQVDFLKGWTRPPVGQWVYLVITVKNPYPNPKDLQRAEKNPDAKLKPVTLTCAMYDANRHLVARIAPTQPPPNAHYVALDEAFMRTWDSGNDYQVDWFYTGPPAGIPDHALLPST